MSEDYGLKFRFNMAAGGLFTRFIGPRYFELAKNWAPTTAAFGATATAVGLYFTDWRVIVAYIPYYGSKFHESDEKK